MRVLSDCICHGCNPLLSAATFTEFLPDVPLCCGQVMSNGLYSSCLHRALNSRTETRMSIAYLYAPLNSAVIKPAPSLLREQHPAVYKDFVYEAYLRDYYKNGIDNKVTLKQYETSNHTLPQQVTVR